MRIAPDVLDRIRSEVDIVDLIGEAVTLTKAGTLHRGLCPFHDEDTPSFTVTPTRQSYHCFGCGAHGNAISWVMEHDRVEFLDAVRALAARVGVDLGAEAASREVERPRGNNEGGDDEADEHEPAGEPAEGDEALTTARLAFIGAARGNPSIPRVRVEATEQSDGTDNEDAADVPPASSIAMVGQPDADTPARRRRRRVPPRFDRAALAHVWTALRGSPASWARAVGRWAMERRLGARIADALAHLDDVAGDPIGRPETELRAYLDPIERAAGEGDVEFVGGLRWRPYSVWFAIRSPDGEVVDVERRCVRNAEAPGGIKGRRLVVGNQLAPHDEGVVFGSIDRAIEVARAGGSVVLVEGGPDFAVAAACCHLSGRGAVLGGVAHTGVERAAQYFASAVERLHGRHRIAPGSFDVYVVPHVGDVEGVGEKSAWSAGVRLLDVARVTWCPPVRHEVDAMTGEVTRTHLRKGDLGDALTGLPDPVAAFWELLGAGRRMLETEDQFERDPEKRQAALRRWRRSSDGELRRAFYRLPR